MSRHTAGNGTPLPVRTLIAHLRKFGRREFVATLAAHARRYYQSEPNPEVLKGDEPWLVAGVAALALMRCYPHGLAPTRDDVEVACRMYFDLQRPRAEGHEFALERLIVPEMYRQAPYQRWQFGEVARPIALFDPLSWKSNAEPTVMRKGWEKDLLDCTITDFCFVGLILFSAALIDVQFPLAEDEGNQDIYDVLGGRGRFEAIAERHYVGDIEWFRRERRAAIEALKRTHPDPKVAEPFVFNPLIKHPLLTGIVPESAIAPAPQEVLRRASAEGVIYEGLAKYEGTFTTDVGYIFEGYVGRQLETIEGLTLHPEIEYRTQQELVATVDWIAVLADVVLLIECKSALPRRDVVEGSETFREGHEQVIKGRKQLITTAAAMRAGGHPELAILPSDRPMVGLVVTLGSFYAANETLVVGERSDELPIGAVDVEFLEGFVTLPAEDIAAFVKRMIDVPKNEHLEPRSLLDGLRFRSNPLLTEVIERLPLFGIAESCDSTSRRTARMHC